MNLHDDAEFQGIIKELTGAYSALRRIRSHDFVSIYGSARISDTSEAAQEITRVASECVAAGFGVITGGGPGTMKAANRGAAAMAHERELPVNEYSIGCAIKLPMEEDTNPFVTSDSVFSFEHFFIRKYFTTHFSKAHVFFEGGGGTRDEFWEVFCLVQNGKLPPMPILLVGPPELWAYIFSDLELMSERKVISPEDAQLIANVPADDVVPRIVHYYQIVERVETDALRGTIEIFLTPAVSMQKAVDLCEDYQGPFKSIDCDLSGRKITFLGMRPGAFGHVHPLVYKLTVSSGTVDK